MSTGSLSRAARRSSGGRETEAPRRAVVLAQFRRRLRDRRFWITQALVITISIGHGLLEATRGLGLSPDLYLLPVSTYFIPVIYAALNFGVAGAVPTALWSALLVVPNLILWHTNAERPGVVLELVILVVIAYVIARRVDFETAAKEHAEAANARLDRLNRTAAASAQSLDLDRVISRTAQAMLDPRKSQMGWIVLGAEGADEEKIVVASTTGAPGGIDADDLAETRSIIAGSHQAGHRESHRAIAPLRASGRLVGAVGLAEYGDTMSVNDHKLLEAVASQLGIALENIGYFRQTQMMVTELSRAREKLQEYVRLATDAQEDERKRLARELHDDTIQALVIARAELDTLAVEASAPASMRVRLARAEAILTTAIENVRRFSRDLRPSLLDDLGLVHAIDWLVSDLRTRAVADARLLIDGEPRRLDQKKELALFRIAQEALHNAERHAGATTVEVRIQFNQDVRLIISDDGGGFEAAQVLDSDPSASRLGLLGMRERAKLAGAALSVTSRPEAGTQVTVLLASTD